MKMELSIGGHICSILQVAALVVCFRGYVSGEGAQGCVGSQLSLRCPEMKVIQIRAVVLGDTDCSGASCCIKDSDCVRDANENHRRDVQRRCDNKQSCTVGVLIENIPCGIWGASKRNDFERITYVCIDDPQIYERVVSITTVSTEGHIKQTTAVQLTIDTSSYSSKPGERGYEERHTVTTTNAPDTNGIVIACVVSVIVIIAIVAISVSVVTVRRKKKQQVKPSEAVKTSEPETDRKEATDVSETQGTSLNENAGSSFPICSNDKSTEVETSLNSGAKNFETTMSEYCDLEEVATGRIQSDREYEQLDHGRNYEPLVVYEQLQ